MYLTIRLKDDQNGKGIKSAITNNAFIRRRWAFYDLFDSAPAHHHMQLEKGVSDDEMHIVVFDTTGDISGFQKRYCW